MYLSTKPLLLTHIIQNLHHRCYIAFNKTLVFSNKKKKPPQPPYYGFPMASAPIPDALQGGTVMMPSANIAARPLQNDVQRLKSFAMVLNCGVKIVLSLCFFVTHQCIIWLNKNREVYKVSFIGMLVGVL